MLLGIYFGPHSTLFLRSNINETRKLFLIERKIHKMVKKFKKKAEDRILKKTFVSSMILVPGLRSSLFLIPPFQFTKTQVSSVQLLRHVQLFATPWTATSQASLSIANSQSLLKLTSIESLMPSSHLILCRPLLLLPSIFPSIRVFSNESVLSIRWLKYWSFSFNISPSSEYSGWTAWISLQSKGLSRVFSNTTVPACASSSPAFLMMYSAYKLNKQRDNI